MNDTIANLLRAEIDLPDDAGHQTVVALFNDVQEALDAATKANNAHDAETLSKLKRRLTTRIIPERVEVIDTELAVKMLTIGIELDKVNKERNKLYIAAQRLMLQAADQGMNQSDIARILGVDRATVRNSTTKMVATTGKDGKRVLKRVPLSYEEYLDNWERAEHHFSTEQGEGDD